jgi:hypothetical protein
MLSQKRRSGYNFPRIIRMYHLLVGVCSHAQLSPSWPLLLRTSRNLVTSEFSVIEPRTHQVKSRAGSWLLNKHTDTKRSSNNEEGLTKRTHYIYITEKLQLSRLYLQFLFPLYQLRSKLLNKERHKPYFFPVRSNLAFYLEIHSVLPRVQFPTLNNIIRRPYKDITHAFGAWLLKK